MTLPEQPTHKRLVIIEVVPAWGVCEDCQENEDSHICPDCNGEGGKWHEAIFTPYTEMWWRNKPQLKKGDGGWRSKVTKSTILQREWRVCGRCDGMKTICIGCGVGASKDGCGDGLEDCKDCNGTGAEPDSQGEWRVKE